MKPKSRRRKRKTLVLGPVPEIIGRIPRPYPSSQEQFGNLISKELRDIWIELLSDAERDELRRKQPVSPSAVEKLDTLILKQAETMGWRLGLSESVHIRFSEWDFEDNGPALFEKYGKALAIATRRFQKKERPPIDDPDLHIVKKETVHELRHLLRAIRAKFSPARIGPDSNQLIDFFQETISSEPAFFVHLEANINSWSQFIQANSTQIKPLLLAKRPSPASLFDSWFSWSKGLEQETVRQKISELGRFVRHRE